MQPTDRNPQTPQMPAIRLGRSSALRAGSLQHVDAETSTAFEKEIANAQAERDKDYDVLKKVASLADHPGWQLLYRDLVERIKAYRSGTAYAQAYEQVKAGKLSLQQYGEMVFNGYTLADELTALFNSISVSQETIEQLNEEERNAAVTARRFMGPAPEAENQ